MSHQTYTLKTDTCTWTISFHETETHVIEINTRTGHYDLTPQGMKQYMDWLISIQFPHSKPRILLNFVDGKLVKSEYLPDGGHVEDFMNKDTERLVDDCFKVMITRTQDTVDAVGRKKYYKDMVAKSKLDDRYVVYPDGSIQFHPLMKITKAGIIEYSEAQT